MEGLIIEMVVLYLNLQIGKTGQLHTQISIVVAQRDQLMDAMEQRQDKSYFADWFY